MLFQVTAEEGKTDGLGTGIGSERRTGKKKQTAESKRNSAHTPFLQHDKLLFSSEKNSETADDSAEKIFLKGMHLLSQQKAQMSNTFTIKAEKVRRHDAFLHRGAHPSSFIIDDARRKRQRKHIFRPCCKRTTEHLPHGNRPLQKNAHHRKPI